MRLVPGLTSFVAAGTIVYKEVYNYQFDRVGNWTKRTTAMVTVENGQLKYEPLSVTYRTFTYYLNEAVNKAVSSAPAQTTALASNLAKQDQDRAVRRAPKGNGTKPAIQQNVTTNGAASQTNGAAKNEATQRVVTTNEVVSQKSIAAQDEARNNSLKTSPPLPSTQIPLQQEDARRSDPGSAGPQLKAEQPSQETSSAVHTVAEKLSPAKSKPAVPERDQGRTARRVAKGNESQAASQETRVANNSPSQKSIAANNPPGQKSGATNSPPPTDKTAINQPISPPQISPRQEEARSSDPPRSSSTNIQLGAEKSEGGDPLAVRTVAESLLPATSEPPIKQIPGDVLKSAAISLPPPIYPSGALSAHVEGLVDVAVTINEQGQVIKAQAITGHPLLRDAAVAAAQGARFEPRRLSAEPGPVSSMISYQFALGSVPLPAYVSSSATTQPKQTNTPTDDSAKMEASGTQPVRRVETNEPATNVALKSEAMVYADLGVAHFRAKRYKQAVEAYQKAISLTPDSAMLYSNLGTTFYTWGKQKEAVEAFKRALALKSEMTEALYGLGLAYHGMGRYKEAARSFERVSALKPEFADAHFSLALAYYHLGKKKAVEQEIQILKTLDKELANQLLEAIAASSSSGVVLEMQGNVLREKRGP